MATTARGKKGQGQNRSQSPNSAAHNKAAADNLLEYYKQRIGALVWQARPWLVLACTLIHCGGAEEFEAERQNFIDRIQLCAAQKAEQHKLEWEHNRRANEVKELQKVCL